MSLFKRKNKKSNNFQLNRDAYCNPQTSSGTEEEQTFDLNDLIKACEVYAGTEDEVFIVQMLADCLLSGTYGITRNLDMACKYYERLAELNKAAGICGIGKVYMAIGLETDNRIIFSMGVLKVYEAYKLGNEEALRVLAFTAEFESFSNLEEFIQHLEKCSDIKQ